MKNTGISAMGCHALQNISQYQEHLPRHHHHRNGELNHRNISGASSSVSSASASGSNADISPELMGRSSRVSSSSSILTAALASNPMSKSSSSPSSTSPSSSSSASRSSSPLATPTACLLENGETSHTRTSLRSPRFVELPAFISSVKERMLKVEGKGMQKRLWKNDGQDEDDDRSLLRKMSLLFVLCSILVVCSGVIYASCRTRVSGVNSEESGAVSKAGGNISGSIGDIGGGGMMVVHLDERLEVIEEMYPWHRNERAEILSPYSVPWDTSAMTSEAAKEAQPRVEKEDRNRLDAEKVDVDDFADAVTEVPRNLIFVTERLPGDAKIEPRALENAGIWQDLYKGQAGYKMHFFPSFRSIEKFLETKAPHYLKPYGKCETDAERFDFARLVVLFILGGISVDISVARPLETFDALLDDLNPLKDREQLIVALDYDFEHLYESKLWAYPRQRGVATHCFAVTPLHPVLHSILERVSRNLMQRNDCDEAILAHGYPPEVLQDPRKAALIRRSWSTGSGPFSDSVFAALKEQGALASRAEVIVLPRIAFMSAHPGGMRFGSLQQPADAAENTLFMGRDFGNPDSDSIRRKTYLVYDESHLPRDTHHSIAPYTYLIGAVRDASDVADTPFEYIVELSCMHGVHVHMVVGGSVDKCRARFEASAREKYSAGERHKCGRFELLGEPSDLHSFENRVDRIAYLRDFQREHLRVVLENGHEDDIVVVADLDLVALPPVTKLMHEVNRMRQLHEYDVLCSNGLMHRPNGYYDLYATVLLPDTFLYPVRHRLLKESWEGEDMTIVRSHDEFGEVTSWDILDWIEAEGEKRRMMGTVDEKASDVGCNPLWKKVKLARQLNDSISGENVASWYEAYENYEEYEFEPSIAVPVRSCFGGLTIYTAAALLEPNCRYHPPSVGDEANRLRKYANLDDKRPCEHVVFHDCLFRLQEKKGVTGRESRIAIQPDMHTLWNDTPVPRNKLISDSDEDALITFFKQGDRGDKLTSSNGKHTLRINADGILILESCKSPWTSACSDPQVRIISYPLRAPNGRKSGFSKLTVAPLRKNWTHMFLVLEGNGNLILLKQVPKQLLKEEGKHCGLKEHESCQLEIWSSNTARPDAKGQIKNQCEHIDEDTLQRYELELTNEGYLEIREWSRNDGDSDWLWRSNGIPFQE